MNAFCKQGKRTMNESSESSSSDSKPSEHENKQLVRLSCLFCIDGFY